MLAGAPFQLAEQAPGGVVQGAVEVGVGVGAVVAVVHAADQAQAVGQAEGVLNLQVVAAFARALVDVTAHALVRAVPPLVQHLIGQGLLGGTARRCGALAVGVHVPGQQFGVIRVQLPQLGQLGAERDLGVAGLPNLPAIPLLGRALDIQAVLGI